MAPCRGRSAGATGALGKAGEAGGGGDGVLPHLAVGGPFAAGDSDEAGRGDEQGVVAGQGSGVVTVAVFDQGAQAGKDAEDIARHRIAAEIARRMFEQKVDLRRLRARFNIDAGYRGVGGADDHPLVPGDGERGHGRRRYAAP